MGKIGRNDPCPCGSGKKFKHCCLGRGKLAPAPRTNTQDSVVSMLQAEIAKLQQLAQKRKPAFWELGVFLLFSTALGDAWFLEITESDAVQVARAGEALDLTIEGEGQTIAINWTHTFKLVEKRLVLRDYATETETEAALAPTQQLNAAIRRIHRRYDQAVLKQVHMPETAASGGKGGVGERSFAQSARYREVKKTARQ